MLSFSIWEFEVHLMDNIKVQEGHFLYILFNAWDKRVFFGMLWNNEIIENISGRF
jgi:hypothetical protein